MKIKLSKTQWQQIGKQAGWTKKAYSIEDIQEGEGEYIDDVKTLPQHGNKQKLSLVRMEKEKNPVTCET